MNLMNSLPTLPDAFFHGSAVAFHRIDVANRCGERTRAKGFWTRVLHVVFGFSGRRHDAQEVSRIGKSSQVCSFILEAKVLRTGL